MHIEVESTFEYTYTGKEETYIVPKSGYYKIELWGAEGGSATYTTAYSGGKGAYTSGIVNLDKNEQLYLHIGGMGQSVSGTSSFTLIENGNGYNVGTFATATTDNSNHGGGGGATDARLVSGIWNNEEGLKSRIIVAAGGGGASSHNKTPSYSGTGGNGGTLIGNNAIQGNTTCYQYGVGGSQTSGGNSATCEIDGRDAYTGVAPFGIGGSPFSKYTTAANYAGGGGGYYGGGTGYHAAAGGGSSFISGYAGVNAITSNTSLTPTNNTLHYSDKYFINGKMEAGVNTGNGKAKITYIGETKPERKNAKLNNVRYIKDCINGSSTNNKNAWNELQVIKNGVNIALNKSVTSTGTIETGNYSFEAVVDGDIFNKSSNAYIVETGLQCVTVDLGSAYDLDEIAVWHYWADGRTFNDNITYVSSDNSNWTEVMHNNEAETSNGKRVSAYEN